MGQPDRCIVFARKSRYTTDMIRVFVRDEYCINIFWHQPGARQPDSSCGKTKTTIHHHDTLTNLNNERVALAATAK